MKKLFNISMLAMGVMFFSLSAAYHVENLTKEHSFFNRIQDLIAKYLGEEQLAVIQEGVDKNMYRSHVLFDDNNFVGFSIFGSCIEKDVTINFKKAIVIKGLFLFKKDKQLHGIYAQYLWDSVVKYAAVVKADSVVIKVPLQLKLDTSFFEHHTGVCVQVNDELVFGCTLVNELVWPEIFEQRSKKSLVYLENELDKSWYNKNYVVFRDVQNENNFCIGYVREVTHSFGSRDGFDYDLQMV